VAFRLTSLHIKDQALQIFGFRQIQHHGVVRSGSATLKQAYAAAGIGRGGGDRALEICPPDVVRTRTRDKEATWAKHFQCAQVQLLVAAQRALHRAPALGKCRRVEDDGVELFSGVGPVAQDLKCVALNPVDLGLNLIAVGFEVALCDFQRGPGSIDAGDPLADARKVESKSALVGADV